MKKKLRLTGGKKGFVAATDEAFSSKVSYPVLRYSNSRGFHVESGFHQADDDVVWERPANYWAHNGCRSILSSQYQKIKADIERD